jgi:predicted dehydrogenase
MSDEPAWTPARRRMWRVQYAGGVLILGTAVITALMWIFGLETKAEAQQQHGDIKVEYRAADDAVKVWAGDQDALVKARLDGISQRIDDQSALLKEIRDLVLRGRK